MFEQILKQIHAIYQQLDSTPTNDPMQNRCKNELHRILNQNEINMATGERMVKQVKIKPKPVTPPPAIEQEIEEPETPQTYLSATEDKVKKPRKNKKTE